MLNFGQLGIYDVGTILEALDSIIPVMKTNFGAEFSCYILFSCSSCSYLRSKQMLTIGILGIMFFFWLGECFMFVYLA